MTRHTELATPHNRPQSGTHCQQHRTQSALPTDLRSRISPRICPSRKGAVVSTRGRKCPRCPRCILRRLHLESPQILVARVVHASIHTNQRYVCSVLTPANTLRDMSSMMLIYILRISVYVRKSKFVPASRRGRATISRHSVAELRQQTTPAHVLGWVVPFRETKQASGSGAAATVEERR